MVHSLAPLWLEALPIDAAQAMELMRPDSSALHRKLRKGNAMEHSRDKLVQAGQPHNLRMLLVACHMIASYVS